MNSLEARQAAAAGSPAERARTLLAQMTLAEKIGQMSQLEAGHG